MSPRQAAAQLRLIADKIDNSRNPSRLQVASALRQVVAAVVMDVKKIVEEMEAAIPQIKDPDAVKAMREAVKQLRESAGAK